MFEDRNMEQARWLMAWTTVKKDGIINGDEES